MKRTRIRIPPAAAKGRPPMVTMSDLGKNGFFGNQLFQYAFLRFYAMRYGLEYQHPNWIGEYLFGLPEARINTKLPPIHNTKIKAENIFEQGQPLYKGRDFKGYYHFFSTRYYLPYQAFFRSLFQPAPYVREVLNEGIQRLRSHGRTIVAIHLRRGDYVKYLHHDWCFISPAAWYKSWLNSFWGELEQPVLYVASDDLEHFIHDFEEYRPLTSRDVFSGFPIPQNYKKIVPSLNNVVMSTDFYPDYHVLRHCDILAISNSTFSFSASMLNEQAKSFYRPLYASSQLIAYDPWNSYPLQNK